MIYVCIKWIFVYFFGALMRRSYLLAFFSPQTGIIIVKHKTHHSSQLCTTLGWALNTHRINIPSTVCDALQISRFTFMTHRIFFAGFFVTLEERGVDGVLCSSRLAQLHDIGVI